MGQSIRVLKFTAMIICIWNPGLAFKIVLDKLKKEASIVGWSSYPSTYLVYQYILEKLVLAENKVPQLLMPIFRQYPYSNVHNMWYHVFLCISFLQTQKKKWLVKYSYLIFTKTHWIPGEEWINHNDSLTRKVQATNRNLEPSHLRAWRHDVRIYIPMSSSKFPLNPYYIHWNPKIPLKSHSNPVTPN